jgi:fructan beta-fructosidase
MLAPKVIPLALLLGCLCQAASTGQSEPRREPLMRETYRPLYHYSPVRNFMNDPNGLVYYRGEYHLFHQYNPFGNQWGHMSWAHAVSRDLIHWEHLPVALAEADGVMIFSGSAVVDAQNTSGFGSKKEPPLVAVYTGHRPADEMQSQCLAYSTDQGRTWTKYAGNPVLPWEKDFRDPKVFWHAPTRKWVMVVTKAADRQLRFYGSADLKRWELLSEFGPAGVPNTVKANWECPDLFQLPIEGEPGKRKWVLHVGMGNGHVSGGSGGEYFIGEFDGKTFHNDNPPATVLWGDYGRDNYAAVSWSGVTAKGGEPYWIGWMSNWQYANDVPTYPWRNILTVPRILSLRRTPGGLRLVQQPVRQLQDLRDTKGSYRGATLSPERPLVPDQVHWGDALEIVAEFEPGTATEFGLSVRRGEGEETLVGYSAASRQLFVDRTRSGKSDFKPGFAGRSSGPLDPQGKRVKLHLFVDRSSVEVFGNEGETVLSELIFPRPESRGLEVFARGGEARLVKLDVWKLKPAFPEGMAAR